MKCLCVCVSVFVYLCVCVCVCEHVCVFVILKAGEYLPGFDEMRQEASRCPVLAVLQLQLRAGLISGSFLLEQASFSVGERLAS